MKILLIFLSALCFFSPSFSQNAKSDSVSDLQLRNAIALYNHFTDGNARIYNGTQYIYYTFSMEGDPFFITGEFTKGWISYEGRNYDSLSLFYDVARNQVVISGPAQIERIVLDNDFIDSFHLSGHTFIALNEDHQQNLYNSGFYDLLYNGHIQLLARRIKTLNPTIKAGVVVTIFYTKDRFYIHKNGLYYLVSNKKEVFKLFHNKIHELKKVMRMEHLKFRRKNFENILARLTAFYDQLTH